MRSANDQRQKLEAQQNNRCRMMQNDGVDEEKNCLLSDLNTGT
jgi:hypothetical protein